MDGPTTVFAAAARGERIRGPLDPDVISAAMSEGMAGLLARAMDEPPRDLQILAAAVETRSTSLGRELARLVAAFSASGVRTLALKGPVASQQLYGSPGLRSFNDLDLLVPEADAARAEAVLHDQGYRDERSMTARQRAIKRRFHNGTALVHAERRSIVDLHWRFGHVQFPLAMRFEDAWERRAVVTISGAAIPALGPSELAVFLCSHAAKHFWFRLEMLAQIAALTRLPLDWDDVDRLASRAGAARRVGLSFLLANDVAGSPLPPLPRCLAAGRSVFGTLRPLWAERRGEPHARGRVLFLILDRRREVFRAAAAAAFVPTHADWEASNVPAPLQWLRRPFRLAAVRLRRR